MARPLSLSRGFVFLLAVLLAGAGESPAPVVSAPAKEDYTLGPKDKIHITVFGVPEMNLIADVSVEGTINFYFLGDVQVAGLTVKQLREKLDSLLSEYIRDPKSDVKIEEYLSKEVQILGAVRVPGTYHLDTNYTTLLKLISMAQGTDVRRGNSGIICRGAANLFKERPAADQPEDMPLHDKDGNEVGGGGRGLLEERLRSMPGVEKVEVDLVALLDYGDPSEDKKVYPGDIVIIGFDITDNPSRNFIWVAGAVRNPQKISWQPGLTVSQAITQCGGITDFAAPNSITITRTNKDGRTEKIKVRLKDIQKGKKSDIPLEPGDQITVPESIF
jgi:polysaccharide export outer membrane protein